MNVDTNILNVFEQQLTKLPLLWKSSLIFIVIGEFP